MRKHKVCLGVLLGLGFFALVGALAPLQAQSSDYLYWATGGNIARVGLDGTDYNFQFITGLTGLISPHGIAINEKYIYWTNGSRDPVNPGNSISRANLDGTDVILNFIPGLNYPSVCAIDDNYIYWLNIFTESPTIGRAKLDGTGVAENFILLSGSPRGIAVTESYIYWGSLGQSGSETGSIGRANLDGTGVNENLITNLTYWPHGVAITQDYIYWANHDNSEPFFTNGWIGRAKLDGTDAEIVFPGPFGTLMSVITKGDLIYWGNKSGLLSWAKLDGSEYHPKWVYGEGCVQLAITPQRVRYTFEGFFSPIENIPTVNKAKAGQAIPVKWRITDKNGQPIYDPASFISITSYSVNCATFAGDPINSLEESAAGSSGLQYIGNGWWQFNWKTSTAYKGQCRTMKLTLDDKSEHTASFSFK